MVDSRSVSRIATHYYKIAHVHNVAYTIYAAKDSAADQLLLELELQIRFQHPRILLTYYNKSLYCFHFGHWESLHPLEPAGDRSEDMDADDPANPASLKLHLLYPQLVPKYSETVSAEQLANPSRVMKTGTLKKDPNAKEEQTDDRLAFASLSFLKAVKKAIVYNLSALGNMSLFGNYVLSRVQGTSAQYGIVQVDPVLLANGDLVVSLSLRNKLALFESSLLNLNQAFLNFASCFVVYVIPSGLRCHLYDTTNMLQSFTHTPPKSSENLLRLLKLSAGVDLTEKQQILWVKLIPNLQHLNNQTSKVSRFVHDVDNKKYILWPWELCMLQFGSVEQVDIPPSTAPSVDPLSLISDFIKHSIQCNESFTQIKPEKTDNIAHTMAPPSVPGTGPYLFSVPSAFSTGASTGGPEIKEEETNIDLPGINADILGIFELQPTENYPMFGADAGIPEVTIGDTNNVLDDHLGITKEQLIAKSEPTENEDEEDDLFGDGSDLELKDDINSVDPVGSARDINEKPQEPNDDASNIEIDNAEDARVETSQDFNSVKNSSPSSLESKKSPKESSDVTTYVGIPKDQMISQVPKMFTPTSYDDPGAPPAIMPTPVITQAPFSNSFGFSSANQTPQNVQRRIPSRGNNPGFSQKEGPQGENMGYAFSPIVFNPIIKSNIDTKYGRGGKFYVDRELSAGPESEPRKMRLRETSVLAYEMPSFHEQSSQRAMSSFGLATDLESTDMNKSDVSQELSMFGVRNPDDPLLGMGSGEDQDVTASEHNGNDEGADMNMDDHEEFDDDEESDVDEDLSVSELKTSPLKLNTHVGDIFHISGSVVPQYESQKTNGAMGNSSLYGNQQMAFLSPGLAPQIKSVGATRGESPFGFGINTVDMQGTSFSPASGELKQAAHSYTSAPVNEDLTIQGETQNDGKDSRHTPAGNTPASTGSSTSGISESSNCLPLILRSINVFSIPNLFMLKNVPGAWGTVTIPSGFNMDVEEEEDDIESKDGGLSVRAKHLDEFLRWLTPNLVFDLGLNKFESRINLNLPELFADDVISDITDGEVSQDVAAQFANAFPLSYRIQLSEFITENGPGKTKAFSESQTELKDQLSFLDGITDGSPLESASPSGRLETLQWDSIFAELVTNKENFGTYKALITEMNHSSPKKVDENAVFNLNDVKAKVLKNKDNIINLNYLGARFWKYLNFMPVNGPKRFQILLISENDQRVKSGTIYDNANSDFLDLLRNAYKENHFGSIKKLNLQTSETRPDLEGISNGIMSVDKDVSDRSYHEFYKRVSKKLKNLAELIKLDLINKTNRFEFGRPLLLLFVNYNESIDSVLQISKICRNFKLFLNDHQLSLVNMFVHVVPWSSIVKQSDNRRRLRYLSNSKLAKLSMNLYNKCPESESFESKQGNQQKDDICKLYTQLVKEPPTTLHFKFLNKINKEGSSSEFHDDIFLHVAYERSVDKNWISAAWSDPLGIVTQVRSWYCTLAAKNGHYSVDTHDLGSIINEIWEVSNLLFKKLNEDVLQRMCGSGNKKFLVLTRINSIIPDDELVFWKRLTTKYKDVSLIVLSTNRMPKFLFSSEMKFASSGQMKTKENYEDPPSVPSGGGFVPGHGPRTSMSNSGSGHEFFKSLNGFYGTNGVSPSSSGVPNSATSPMYAGTVGFHSPHQFLNAPTNFLSPQEGTSNPTPQSDAPMPNDADYVMRDQSLDVIGVIPKTPLPSFNLPTRLGMRIGYLIKEAPQQMSSELRYMVFEVTLLSCSAYWSLSAIMKILLSQYKKLIVLNDILGTTETDSRGQRSGASAQLRALVPWHINAVVKALDYLVHVYVEEQS